MCLGHILFCISQKLKSFAVIISFFFSPAFPTTSLIYLSEVVNAFVANYLRWQFPGELGQVALVSPYPLVSICFDVLENFFLGKYLQGWCWGENDRSWDSWTKSNIFNFVFVGTYPVIHLLIVSEIMQMVLTEKIVQCLFQFYRKAHSKEWLRSFSTKLKKSLYRRSKNTKIFIMIIIASQY